MKTREETVKILENILGRKVETVDDRLQLHGTDLRNADLSDVDLSSAVLSNTNLHNADLSGANLDHANLSWSILTGVNFSGASLVKTNLTGVMITKSETKYVLESIFITYMMQTMDITIVPAEVKKVEE